MDDLLVVTFEAHHPDRDHHRWYEVSVGWDLFDHWTITIRYGRIGQQGHERRYAATTAEAGRTIIRAHLRRRLTAPGRIGCAYRFVGSAGEGSVDPSEWFPADLMARLGATSSDRLARADPLVG